MQVFKTKWFTRFARNEGIADKSLHEAIKRAERGLVDADLGGGLIKQRVARRGRGRSSGYRVIVDRISQDIPFYRAYLKNAELHGTIVVNNPFWWTADDKFFNYALAHKMGVAIPPTVILPHHKHPPDTTDKSMRNLMFPLNWQQLFDYVGFPAFLKPYSGGGWKHVYHVHSPEEFFHHYNQTGDLCMTLQSAVKFQEYFRCYVINQKKVHKIGRAHV